MGGVPWDGAFAGYTRQRVRWGRRTAAARVWLPPEGLVQRGCTPHFLFHLVEKKTGRARSKRKDRFWSQLCTCVQSCCTGVGVRGCLRVCEDWTTGAAGYRRDLTADSRGAVHLGSGCKDAFDPFLFPRVPLRYALPRALVGAVGRIWNPPLQAPLRASPTARPAAAEKGAGAIR